MSVWFRWRRLPQSNSIADSSLFLSFVVHMCQLVDYTTSTTTTIIKLLSIIIYYYFLASG